MSESWLVLLWIIYFILHSLLAASVTKVYLTRSLFHGNIQAYRLAYNVFALGGILALFCCQFFVPSRLMFRPVAATFIAGIVLALSGLSIMFVAVRHYDWKGFIGLREEKNYSLVISGLNRYVRHPLYSGTVLLFVGFCLWQPYYKNALLLVMMLVYLAIGIYYEEKKLENTYGETYRQYKKKVKKMIPGVW